MVKHNLKMAFRNMQKQKKYVAINTGGFAFDTATVSLLTSDL